MRIATVKKEIHEYIDQADQRFLTLVYSMVQAEKGNQESLDDKLRAEMITRAEASERDIAEGRTISAQDFKLKLEGWKQVKRESIK